MNKINLKINLKQYLVFEKISWIILGLALVINIILWILWHYKSQYNNFALYYSTGVLLVNAILAFFIAKKEVLVEYLLIGGAFFVQILTLILLLHTI